MLEIDQIKLELPVVASIMNFAGYKGLLNYLSLETYKKVVKDEYLNFKKVSDYSFIKSESQWIKFMDKLVDMDLAAKNGKYYVTKRKLKGWRTFSEKNTPQCMKLNGYIIFNMSDLYNMRNEENIKDFIYLSLVENVIKGKSISRKFIKDITGVSSNIQRKIEKKYKDNVVFSIEHHVPISDREQSEGMVNGIPVFKGAISPKHMYCTKTKKEKSNCEVIQLGNKLKIKKLNISYFVSKKVNVSKKKSKLLNDSFKNEKVEDWDNFDMVLDTSIEGKSNKFRGILSINDPRYISWKDFKHYDYENVAVLTGNGALTDVRSILNQ